LLPHVVDANLRALEARAPEQPARARFEEVARLLTADASARAEDGVEWLRALVQDVRIPRLSACGLAVDHFPEVVEHASRANSMKSNPIALTPGELTDVLSAAL
jgi:alcohol dehydrogenase class IV